MVCMKRMRMQILRMDSDQFIDFCRKQWLVALLELMMNDPVNYVRQEALLASALVQHTEFPSSKVKDI